MNHLFARRRQKILELQVHREARRTGASPAAFPLQECPGCQKQSPLCQWTQGVCPQCGYHSPIGAYHRLSLVLDPGSFRELDAPLAGLDPLGFPQYREKLEQSRRRTGISEAIVTARGRIDGRPVVVGALDSRFLMGSMGIAVGEKVARAAEAAQKAKAPLILFSASGGARMQEGIISLMQMAKTAAAIQRFQDTGGLFIACFTHPTTGGVTASFASLGDLTLAEPGALIGFAGLRVIQQTIGETLPQGFQRSEYLEAHGFLDAIVPRSRLRDTLAQLLRLHQKGQKAKKTAKPAKTHPSKRQT